MVTYCGDGRCSDCRSVGRSTSIRHCAPALALCSESRPRSSLVPNLRRRNCSCFIALPREEDFATNHLFLSLYMDKLQYPAVNASVARLRRRRALWWNRSDVRGLQRRRKRGGEGRVRKKGMSMEEEGGRPVGLRPPPPRPRPQPLRVERGRDKWSE